MYSSSIKSGSSTVAWSAGQKWNLWHWMTLPWLLQMLARSSTIYSKQNKPLRFSLNKGKDP
ncbi:hypothetical protein MHBO_000080 [Bonamia ostreae]|uniref:Uncharacterized protein n=1 Tax=Bonamia ostreae TaxID=126728 RepID=A0ABV2AEC6_9EUKA